MNNLHRKLAPISDAAWEQIEEEASRTLKRYLAARRVVDVADPQGAALAAIGTGHLNDIQAPDDGIRAGQHQVQALVELRVPFELSRRTLDDVERGSDDPDLQPLKDAARKIAYAEDRAVFDGYAAAGIQGMRPGSDNPATTLPSDITRYPAVVAQALSQLRLAGVNGPYILVLGEKAFAAVSGASDDGYPLLKHIRPLLDGDIVWAPGIEGGVLLSTRGGDFSLHLGQDISIGYQSHTDSVVNLYLQESFTFRLLSPEAAVALMPSAGK
ncbi:family 1 encapsulin nanocompartment shell protein [Paracandidimonas soli]|uniref:Putative linocin/CFP29 family protein n=1 Tax=Paracandidimonas soli TaxID=1917182 RepID=A0A4V2VSK4_9BURK|nr:family 1 encapsulin nanocompartment shell protein [Paracandidimonas soli]TCV02740.1 putative linocin/CFP29 family protein [Paracandidimonas soli]